MTDASQHPAGPSDNTTLTEVVDGYRSDGFDGDFFAEDGALIRCGRCASVIEARQLDMHSMRRLEGASDPADMVAVIATTCPVCGGEGTLVVGYGPMSSEADSDVLFAIRDARDDDVAPPASSSSETAGADVDDDTTVEIVPDQGVS